MRIEVTLAKGSDPQARSCAVTRLIAGMVVLRHRNRKVSAHA